MIDYPKQLPKERLSCIRVVFNEDVVKSELDKYRQGKYGLSFWNILMLLLGVVLCVFFIYACADDTFFYHVLYNLISSCSNGVSSATANMIMVGMALLYFLCIALCFLGGVRLKEVSCSTKYCMYLADYKCIDITLNSIGYAVHAYLNYEETDGFVGRKYLGLFLIKHNSSVEEPTLDLDRKWYILP